MRIGESPNKKPGCGKRKKKKKAEYKGSVAAGIFVSRPMLGPVTKVYVMQTNATPTHAHAHKPASGEREREIQRLREGTGKNETPVGGGDDLLFISVCGILTPSSDPFLIAPVCLSRHRRLLGHASSWSASEVHLAANQRAAWRGVKLNPSNAARTVLERAGEDEPAADVCVCASMCVLGCYQSCRLPATDEVIRPFSKADFFPPVRFG